MEIQKEIVTKRLGDVMFAASGLLLLVVGALINLDIALSNANFYLQGVNEVGPIIAIWITFLALPSITIEGEHVRIDYFYERLPERWKRITTVFINILLLSSLLIIIVSAYETIMVYGLNRTPNLGLPVYLIYIPLMVGTGVTIVYYAEQEIRSFQAR